MKMIVFDHYYCDNYPKVEVAPLDANRWQRDMVACLRSDIAYARRTGLADHVVCRIGIIRQWAGGAGVGFKQLREDLQEAIRAGVKVCRDSALIVNLGPDVPPGQWFTVDKEKSRQLQAARLQFAL